MNNTKLRTTLLAAVLAAGATATTAACGDALATQNYRGDPLLTLRGTLDRSQALAEERHDVAALFVHVACTAEPGSTASCDDTVPRTLRTTVVKARTSDGYPQDFALEFESDVDRAALIEDFDPDFVGDPANDDEIARVGQGMLVSGTPEALAAIPAELPIDGDLSLPAGVALQAVDVIYRENWVARQNGFSIVDHRPNLPIIHQASCIRTNLPAVDGELTGAVAEREQQCLNAHGDAFACIAACDEDEACIEQCPAANETVSPCLTETCGAHDLTSAIDCRYVATEEFLGGLCPYPQGFREGPLQETRTELVGLRRADDVSDIADDVLRTTIDRLPVVVEQP